MLKSTRFLGFIVSELLKENQQGGNKKTSPPRLGLTQVF